MSSAISKKGYEILSFIASAGDADMEALHEFLKSRYPESTRKATQVLLRYYLAQKWVRRTGARRIRVTLRGLHRAGLSTNVNVVYKIKPNKLTGSQLVALRIHRGMNQQQFADAMQVNVRTVSRWETGVVPIPSRVVTYFAD